MQVPHVNTADEARAVVDAVKYGPEGHRGLFSGGRAARYGFAGNTVDYAAEANRQTLVCIMIEDVFFIGSGDLSQSMGYTGQQAHPEIQHM